MLSSDDRFDGVWIPTGPSKPAVDTSRFFLREAEHASAALAVEELRVDVFDPAAVGAISGRVLVDGRRAEEFRAEVRYQGCDYVIQAFAETPARRSVYLLEFDLDPTHGVGRLHLQRLETPSPLSEAGGRRTSTRVFEAVCRQQAAGKFRRLDLTCRPDALLRATPNVRDAVAVFRCADALAAEFNVDLDARDRAVDTVEGALSRAGIAVSSVVEPARRSPSCGERLLNALEGSDPALNGEVRNELLAWSPADLDELVAGPGTAPASNWGVALAVVARLQDRPQVVGTMFSTQHHPRRGCALCVEPAGGDAWAGGDRRRALRFAATHELGHALNLLHAFEADQTTHRPQPRRATLATFMNYPNRYPFGSARPPLEEDECRTLFWRRFDGTFGHDELIHLRHGWEHATRPGGAIEKHMLGEDVPSTAGRGLQEAGGGAFTFDGLVAVDPILDRLFGAMADDAERADEMRLQMHLPRELELGEPVIGWFAVENNTAEPRLVPADLDPAGGQVVVEIERRGGPTEPFVSARRDCGAGLAWLLPGERRTARLQLSFGWGCHFTEPGTYRVTTILGGALETSTDVVVHPPATAKRDDLDRLFADERLGLAVVGERNAASDGSDLAWLAARRDSLPAGLAGAMTNLEDRIAVREASDGAGLELALERQLRQATVAPGYHWREGVRSLHETAIAMLLRDDLPTSLVARSARRVASTSLALTNTHAGGPSDELGTRLTAAAITTVADRLASSD